MGVKIAVYVRVVGGVSFWFWDDLSQGESSVSAVTRNLVLMWGPPLARIDVCQIVHAEEGMGGFSASPSFSDG